MHTIRQGGGGGGSRGAAGANLYAGAAHAGTDYRSGAAAAYVKLKCTAAHTLTAHTLTALVLRPLVARCAPAFLTSTGTQRCGQRTNRYAPKCSR